MTNADTTPEYVLAAHFIDNDDAALFGALRQVEGVDFVVVEDPSNPLLRRHAEIYADETVAAASAAAERFAGTPFAHAAIEMAGTNRNVLVENELKRLRDIMGSHGMGVFALSGTRKAVEEFSRAHLAQPGPNDY